MQTQNEKVPVIKYIPYNHRFIDKEYRNVLSDIVSEGKNRKAEFHNGTMRKRFARKMEFKMRNGFPLITERKISEKAMRWAIAEIIGFIHGATTLNQLKKFGLPKFWWKRWTALEHVNNPDGTPKFNLPKTDLGEHLGRFSYGGIWGRFPTQKGGEINQWKNIIKQMINHPTALTHRVVNWYPPGIIVPKGKRWVVVAPCHGDVQIELDEVNKLLTLMHVQRSADVPCGVPWNMIHYAAIGMMLSLVLGYTFDEYHHILLDCHMYNEKQSEGVSRLLERDPLPLPTVTLDFKTTGNPVKDFFAIRPKHFHLSDYKAHPYFKFETEL